MSNSPISGLPPATTLDGTESVPVVQAGVTKQAATSLFRSSIPATLLSPLSVTVASVTGLNLLSLTKTSGTQSVWSFAVGTSADLSSVGGSFSGTLASMAFSVRTGLGIKGGLLLNNPTGNYVDVGVVTGDLQVQTAGKGLQVKEGANAKQGVAVLAAGQVVIANTSVTANSRIFLTPQNLGTVAAPKALGVTARTAGTSFTITSADATDTSSVAWEIFEPAA